MEYFFEKEKRIRRAFTENLEKAVVTLIIDGLPEQVAKEVLKQKPQNGIELRSQLKTFSPWRDRTSNWSKKSEGDEDSRNPKKMKTEFEKRNFTKQAANKPFPVKKVDLVGEAERIENESSSEEEYGKESREDFTVFRVQIEREEHRLPSKIADESDSEYEMDLFSHENLDNADRNIFTVKANGKETKATLDSGTKINIIGMALVSSLELTTFELSYDVRVRGFNNKVQGYNLATTFDVSLGAAKTKISALIVPEADDNLLFCIRTLYKLGVQWDFRLGTLAVRNEQDIVIPVLMIESDWHTKVREEFGKLCESSINENPSIIVSFDLKEDATVVKKKPYGLSYKKLEWAKQKISELLKMGVVVHSESPFASPCVIVTKENGNFGLT